MGVPSASAIHIINLSFFDGYVYSKFFSKDQRFLSKVSQPQSVEDKKRYILLDELDDKMARKKFYVLVNLTDKVMGIGQSGMPYDRDH